MDTNDSLETGRSLVRSITRISASLSRVTGALGRQIGVTAPQYVMLSVVEWANGGKGVKIREVANILQVDASFVSTQSKILQQLGMIQRRSSKDDSRIILLSLTPTGRQQMLTATGRWLRLHKLLETDLGQQNLDQLMERLEHFQRRLSKIAIIAELDD